MPCIAAPEDLQFPLSLLSISGLSHFELEDMFEEGQNCMEACMHLFSQENVLDRPIVFDDDEPSEVMNRVSVIALIAGSESFRQHLLKLKTDSIYCGLMQSNLATFLSSSNIRFLAQGGKEIEITRIGTCVYTSRESKICTWYVLISGKLSVRLDELSPSEDDSSQFELNPGEVFGGYGIQQESSDQVHVKIDTVQSSKLIELSDERLSEFSQQEPEAATRLLSMMAGQ